RARAGQPADVGQPAGRAVQPAAGAAAGRRPDAARRNLEAHPPPGTATLGAAWTGRVIAAALLLVPFALFARDSNSSQVFDAAWLAVIAAFMWLGAGQAIKVTKVRERLPGLQARLLARRALPIPASLPLAEAIRRADAAQARAL